MPTKNDKLIAIDILLEPDATMIQRATAVNTRLREVFPQGFALDAAHRPHITLLQRYVYTADLDKIYAAVGKILANHKVNDWRLKAFKYHFLPWKDMGVVGIVVGLTEDLLKLQQKLIAVVAPFTAETGTAAAFVATPEDPDINQPTLDYVAAFVPAATGQNFNPHVTIGIASQDYLKKMITEPFDEFVFSPVRASIFQIGNYGVAAKRLWQSQTSDPLPSWNDGPAKKSIVEFVAKVTEEGSPDFVPSAERVATFDNDGTLWAEMPAPFQALFVFDRVKALAPQHPEWQDKEPFAALLKGDMQGALAGGERALLELVMATHAGMTTEEFEKIVKDWIATTRHPKTGQLYTEMVYQPMLELLVYLRANGFKTFIVSGGGVEFMRVFAEETYGIPPEQVVGSSGKMKFEMRDGVPVLVKLPEINFIDDNVGKPVGIQHHIGRRPIAAFGNSDGDLQMLQWTAAGSGPRFCLIVHHTDAEREWAYERAPIGVLAQALDEAKSRGWTLVSMKSDWQRVFAFEQY